MSNNIVKTVKMIDDHDWDDLVVKTYGRPYCFQQQNGCRERGIYSINIMDKEYNEDEDPYPESIDENADCIEQMGTKFSSWLKRNPEQPVGDNKIDLEIFWTRKFYPDVEILASDMCKKGLIEPGEYYINVYW